MADLTWAAAEDSTWVAADLTWVVDKVDLIWAAAIWAAMTWAVAAMTWAEAHMTWAVVLLVDMIPSDKATALQLGYMRTLSCKDAAIERIRNLTEPELERVLSLGGAGG